MVHIGDQASSIASLAQYLGQGVLILRDRPPTGGAYEVTLQAKIPVVERIYPLASVYGPPGWQGWE
jgi:hypothetical protein